MTVRNLQAMFKPATVALLGASTRPGSVGAVVAQNLFNAGFTGEIYPVNSKYREVAGHRCYPDIDSLPGTADLAVIATPPDTVPGLIAQLGSHGTKAAVVITAGFGEGGNEEGKRLEAAMLAAARPHLLRIVGPNCLGIMVPGHCLNAGFGHVQPLTGNLAFVGQSGAILTSVLDWATSRDIGFSHFVSIGAMSDVDFGDILDYLAADGQTRAILLYIESITHARKFMSAARAASRLKPVIVVKGGRFAEGARAAASHTGALIGLDAVYGAAFRRAGILRVMDLEALFNAVETLAMAQPLSGDRLAILTNGGGVGVLATDTLIEKGGHLASLSPDTISRLNGVLPPTWSHTNPVDIIGDATGSRYREAMAALLEDREVNAILVLHCPTAITSATEAAQAVIDVVKASRNYYRRPTLLTSWLGDGTAVESRRMFRQNRIPSYQTPDDAIRGFMQMVRFHHNQEMLIETPPAMPSEFVPETGKARAVIDRALAERRGWLMESEICEILSAYAIPVVDSVFAATPEAAARAAESLGGPVAIKILSEDILHKSEVGGVILDLESPAIVQLIAEAMGERVRRLKPEARLQGFTIQRMVRRPQARELILGMLEDPGFGPVILFGHGGTEVEVVNDQALALPPLNLRLAREVMERTRIYQLLQGYRSTPAANLDEIALTLVKISQLICDFAEIVEMDINPLLADEHGVIALDARMRISPATSSAAERLAIRPYPSELEEILTLPDDKRLLLRPIRPEDEPGFQEIFAALSPEEVRMRFLHPMKNLPHKLAARLTQIDYDREMALVLEDLNTEGKRLLYGGVRISADPDNEEAEFAILLRREMTGSGLGPMLLRRIIDYSRNRGIRRLVGEVLLDNKPMLKLAGAFGFTVRPVADDPGIRKVELEL